MEIEEEIHINSESSICEKNPTVAIRFICLECSKFEICQHCQNFLRKT